MPTANAAHDAAIREQAYYFWEADGKPDGHDTEYWTRAEVAVAEHNQIATLTASAPEKMAKPRKAAASKSAAVPGKKSKKLG